MALPTIYFGKTRQVPIELFKITMAAVAEMLQFLPKHRRPIIKDLGHWGDSNMKKPYASWDWYQNTSLIEQWRGYGQQVDAGIISNKLQSEPHRRTEPHIDVALFDRDFTVKLNGGLLNFVFGISSPSLGCILSVARFIKINNRNIRQLTFRRMVHHEFGHILGLVYRSQNCGTSGLEKNHCAGQRGPCAMRQTYSVEELIKKTLEEVRVKVILCPDCINEVQSYFPKRVIKISPPH